MTQELDLAAIVDGARLAGVLPYVEAELQKGIDACIVRMDQMLSDGKLTPELAQMAWIELLSYRRRMRRLTQKVRIGVASGERQAALLTGEPPLPGVYSGYITPPNT
jgi:hypothetical protein